MDANRGKANDQLLTSSSQIQGWQKIEDDVLEEQMTRFLQNEYKDKGYSVRPVQVRKIYTREGQVCAELDGLLIADSQEKESMLVTVEAKHVLREDDITDRRNNLGKFIDTLANIPAEDDKSAPMNFRSICNLLRLYKDLRLEHYIGAVYVPESDDKIFELSWRSMQMFLDIVECQIIWAKLMVQGALDEKVLEREPIS
jgi:hypothetical protein